MANTTTRAPAKTTTTVRPAPPASRPHGKAAAHQVKERQHVHLSLPVIGRVELPQPNDMAFYAGVGALVALELMEWPAAVALAAGHALLNQHHNRALEEFGEALEEV